jgi:DNA modification methylase
MKRQAFDNQLWCIDCVKGMRRLADRTVDLTVTSPPWDNIFKYSGTHGWGWSKFCQVAKELYRVTKKGGVVCWDIADGIHGGFCSGSTVRQACYFLDLGFKLYEHLVVHNNARFAATPLRHGLPPEEVFVFSKGKPKIVNRREKPNRPGVVGKRFKNFQPTWEGQKIAVEGAVVKPMGKRQGIWPYTPCCPKCGERWSGDLTHTTWPEFAGSSIKRYFNHDAYGDHPASMSAALVTDLIEAYSSEGDMVLEPFCGSGTTPVQAMKTGRLYLAMEIHDKYAKLADRRLNETLDMMMR